MTLNRLSQLEYLDLSLNSIKALPTCFFLKQIKLQVLKLNDNSFPSLDFHMNALMSLIYLDISGNLPLSFANMKDLDTLSEKGNISVHLYNNSLQCNCDSLTFLKWLTETTVRFPNMRQYKCSFDNGSFVTFADVPDIVNKLEMECISRTVVFVSLVVFIGMTLIISIPIIVKYKWFRLHYMYHVGRRHLNPFARLHVEDQTTCTYDVFISCSPMSNNFLQQLLNYVESNQPGVIFYNPELEAHGGRNVKFDSIKPIAESCCTLALLDTEYMFSEKVFEFTCAVDEGIHRKHQCLIIVIMENIEPSCVPEEILMYCKNNTDCYIYEFTHIDQLFECLKQEIEKYKQLFNK